MPAQIIQFCTPSLATAYKPADIARLEMPTVTLSGIDCLAKRPAMQMQPLRRLAMPGYPLGSFRLRADGGNEGAGPVPADPHPIAESITRDGPAGCCPVLSIQYARSGTQVTGSTTTGMFAD